MSRNSWDNELETGYLYPSDQIAGYDDAEWGVSADILVDVVHENKQAVDNIILSKEEKAFLLLENVLKQEFISRQDISKNYSWSGAEEESRRVIREEFTRSYVTISVNATQPDVIDSVAEVRDMIEATTCIFHYYQPNFQSWSSTLKSTIFNQPNLKNYLNSETLNDRQIMVKLSQFNLRQPQFEPLFGSLGLYGFIDGAFTRISELHKFDLTPALIRQKYSFLYNRSSDSGSSAETYDNCPCIFSIPRDISHDNLFIISTITKILTGSPEMSIAAYLKSNGQSKVDETKHVELTKRLMDYRQTVGLGIIRVFDEQERCGLHGGPNVSFPVFAYRQAISDIQLGSLVRDLIPVGHASSIPNSFTVQKSKIEVLDLDMALNVTDIANMLKFGAPAFGITLRNSNKLGDLEVISSAEYFSTLKIDSPLMTDNPMPELMKNNRMKEPKPRPIVKLKTFLPPGMAQRSSEIIRHMFTTEESMMYLYPTLLENFKDRNLCVQIELVEFSVQPSSSFSLSSLEHTPLPCIVNQNRFPYLATAAYSTVFYHNKSPSLHDEIKIRLPESLTSCHYLKFTVQHIHVKPRYVNGANFLGGLLASNQSKEMDSSYVVLGVGYQPILTNDSSGQCVMKDGEYNIQITETLMGPVGEPDLHDSATRRKTMNLLPSIHLVTRTLSAFNSSCPFTHKMLRNFPCRGGFFPSSSHERYGDSSSGLSMKEHITSKENTFASEEVLLATVRDLITQANTYEMQKFFFVEFRYFYRLLTYQLNENKQNGYVNVSVEDKRSDDDSREALVQQLRSTSFLGLVKLFSIMSGEPIIHKKDSHRTGGEATLLAYIELLFDEEEDSLSYHSPATEDSPTTRARSNSFSYSEVYYGANEVSTLSSEAVEQVAEYFVLQSERFIFESLIQEIIDDLDVSVFTEILGSSNSREFSLPHKCIRWWTEQITNSDSLKDDMFEFKHKSYPFDFEGEWFKNIESLHRLISPSFESKLFPKEVNDTEVRTDDGSLVFEPPNIIALPFLPKYDRLLQKHSAKLWMFEQLSIQWLSLLLAIRMISPNQGREIHNKFAQNDGICIDSIKAFNIILSDPLLSINIQEIKNQLANNSHVLFKIIFKSLCLRITRENLKTPIILPDNYISVLIQLFVEIGHELSDDTVGLLQSRRMTFAMAHFFRSLLSVLVPNQIKLLLQPIISAYSNTNSSELLELKLILLDELANVDNFVSLNSPFTDDVPFSTLLICGYPQEKLKYSWVNPDKYASTGNYRYIAALGKDWSLKEDIGELVFPSWYALGLVNEYFSLMRQGDASLKKAAMSSLRNMISRPFHDMRFNNDDSSKAAFSRLSTLFLPLLLNFISGMDKLNSHAYDSRHRKEILIITVGLLQSLSEKNLRELVRFLCHSDDYSFEYRMPITPVNPDKSYLYPQPVESLGLQSKLHNLRMLLHLCLDTFERPSVADQSNLQAALTLLVPGARVDVASSRFTPQAGNTITLTTSHSSSEILSSTHNDFVVQSSGSTRVITDDGVNKRINGQYGLEDFQSPRTTNKSSSVYMPFNQYMPPNTDKFSERKRLADVIKTETFSREKSSPRYGSFKGRNMEFMALEWALTVASMTSNTVLKTIQAMLEEIPQLIKEYGPANTSESDGDNLLHFMSSIQLLLLHALFTSPDVEVKWKIFHLSTWIIQHFGYHMFYHAAGQTLQHWVRKSLLTSFDTTAIVESNQPPQIYESPRGSPDIIREYNGEIDGSSHFIAVLLFSCFNYTGSIISLKDIVLSISQECITTTFNEDQEGFYTKRSLGVGRKRLFSSIDILRDRFNTVFQKIMTACTLVTKYYTIPESSAQAFLSSVSSLIVKIKVIVKAYAYVIRQIGVDRIIRFNFNGENSLDGICDSVPVLDMNANDMVEIPKVVTPIKIDYHHTIELMMKAALVFDPLYLPRFHIFWLENIAMIHDIYGNVAESAIARLRIYDVCKDVSDVWGTLWTPQPPIKWTGRNHSDSSDEKRDFFQLFLSTSKGPRPQAWKDWNQYRQHIKTTLMKTISILSAAGVVRWEQKVSAELVSFFQYEGENLKVAEEYSRLGASVTRAAKRGLDKFSTGNFYRVHYSGSAIPEHLRDKIFIYRDGLNLHISEFQENIIESLKRLVDKGVDIIIGVDYQEIINQNNRHKAVVVLGSIRPAFEDELGQYDSDYSHKVDTFKYEIPFTLSVGKSHSQKIDEQYKKKITLRVEEPFPCIFVRQEVVQKDTKVLSPLEVAIDDIRERVDQMNKFLEMRNVLGPTVLREMMRVLQGSIMPQVNAGVAEVAKAFLGNNFRSRDTSSPSVLESLDGSEKTAPIYNTAELKVVLIQFLDASRRLLRRIVESIEITDSHSSSNFASNERLSSTSRESFAINNSHHSTTSKDDLNSHWVDQMKKAYNSVYELLDPLVNDVFDRGMLRRSSSASASNFRL